MNKVVGLSLSFCIADLIKGDRKYEDVSYLVTATRCSTEEEWEQVISSYSRSYTEWRKNPNHARRLVMRLREEGKVFQPRLCGKEIPSIVDLQRCATLDGVSERYYPWIPAKAWEKHYPHK
jgi:hypothetical protein